MTVSRPLGQGLEACVMTCVVAIRIGAGGLCVTCVVAIRIGAGGLCHGLCCGHQDRGWWPVS